MKTAIFAIALALAASAAGAQSPPLTPDVTFNVDQTMNGVTTTTTYHLSRPALEALSWQASQYVDAARIAQKMSQTAGAFCLTDPSAATPPGGTWNFQAPIPNMNFDWTVNRLIDPRDQAVLSVVPVTGAVYRNGMRLGSATVQKLCLYGEIFGKGKTSGTWFRWVGVSAAVPTGWQNVPTDSDATVLN